MSIKITPAKALLIMAQTTHKGDKLAGCQVPEEFKEKWQATITAQKAIHIEALKENEKWEAIKNGS